MPKVESLRVSILMFKCEGPNYKRDINSRTKLSNSLFYIYWEDFWFIGSGSAFFILFYAQGTNKNARGYVNKNAQGDVFYKKKKKEMSSLVLGFLTLFHCSHSLSNFKI